MTVADLAAKLPPLVPGGGFDRSLAVMLQTRGGAAPAPRPTWDELLHAFANQPSWHWWDVVSAFSPLAVLIGGGLAAAVALKSLETTKAHHRESLKSQAEALAQQLEASRVRQIADLDAARLRQVEDREEQRRVRLRDELRTVLIDCSAALNDAVYGLLDLRRSVKTDPSRQSAVALINRATDLLLRVDSAQAVLDLSIGRDDSLAKQHKKVREQLSTLLRDLASDDDARRQSAVAYEEHWDLVIDFEEMAGERLKLVMI